MTHYDPKNDYYKRIGVSPTATAQEIQRAYRKQAKKLHPDRNPEQSQWATEQFQLLNEAYKVLNNPLTRGQYDKQRRLYRQTWGYTSTPSGGINWWDVPHPKSSPRRSHRRRPKPSRRHVGTWLDTFRLGFLIPLYITIYDLLQSPYRKVLILLSVVLVANCLFILFFLPQNEALQATATPAPTFTPQPTHAPAEGLVPQTAEARVIALRLCPPEFFLHLQGIEPLLQSVKITAAVEIDELKSRNVRLIPIEPLGNGQVRLLQPEQAVELLLVPYAGQADSPLEAGGLSEGSYLIQWTPILPDGSVYNTCHQPVHISG